MKYIHNKKWLGYKKEWSTDTCYNMNELWKHYAKWKELVTYDSTYMICPK